MLLELLNLLHHLLVDLDLVLEELLVNPQVLLQVVVLLLLVVHLDLQPLQFELHLLVLQQEVLHIV